MSERKIKYDYFLSGVPQNDVPNGSTKEVVMITNSLNEHYRTAGFQIKFKKGLEASIIQMKDGKNKSIIDGQTTFSQLGNSMDAAIVLDVVPFEMDFPHQSKLIISLEAIGGDITDKDFSFTLFLEKVA